MLIYEHNDNREADKARDWDKTLTRQVAVQVGGDWKNIGKP